MILLVLALALAEDPVDAGRALYDARCAVCHGPEGRGDGPAAAGLSVRPPDMRTEAFWAIRTPDDLRTVITSGTPSGTMRANRIAPEPLDALVAYLQTFEP